MGLIFAFDIGIASVGWAVVDLENRKILELGSNLFNAADAENNVTRRNSRQLRRLHRRHFTRINDFKKLWEKSVGEIPKNLCTYPLELRVKGLTEKLTKDELYYVLLNMLQHRGISYLEDALEDGASSAYEKSLKINQEESMSKFPCQIQLERLQRYGQYRGEINANVGGETVVFSNVFTTGAYLKELEQIFSVQVNAGLVSADFAEEYKQIFSRKRKYYEGPGNELSRTDYGKYTTAINPETGEYITEDNIFNKLIGKCSVYPEEFRAPGASYTAQEFNALNDLNNLTVNGRKLDEDEKKAIVTEYLSETTISVSGKRVRKIIEKVIKEPVEDFSGARIDAKEEEIFHTFECYRKLKKFLGEIEIDINEFSRDELDEIARILTINTDKESITTGLRNSELGLEEDVVEILYDFRRKNGQYFTKWHSFSLKLMNDIIPAMYEQPKEQMTILTEAGYLKSNNEKYKGLKYIPTDEILEEIYNPVVRRSVNITIKILNALIKKYGAPDQVVIEMPRDRNSDEEKERLRKEQNQRGKELDAIIKCVKDEFGIAITNEHFRGHKELGLKLKLWNEQDGICLYSGKPIQIDELINNPNLFEIDHIIPRSISLDNSRNNKVLVYANQNQAKKNNTPYFYLNYGEGNHLTYEEFKARVFALKKDKKIQDKKYKNLLFTQDIYKIDVVRGFINRNLNDTTYASKLVLNTFQDFFAANGRQTKVKVIRGAFTHQMREGLNLKKDRTESYAHHAIDAALIAFAQIGYDSFEMEKSRIIDIETGEILDNQHDAEILSDDMFVSLLYRQKWYEITQEINRAEKEVKYWHRVDTKPNRQLSNATIYGTRESDGKTYKIGKVELRSKDIMKNWSKKDFLMKELDPQTFAFLEDIVEKYRDAQNPFVEYESETGDTIRKYSKKGNGPKIEYLKYRDGEVGSCIDISHKYGHEKGSRKVILDSLNPFRMDVFFDKKKEQYYLIGVKYAMCKFDKGKYVINPEEYERELIREKVLPADKHYEDLEELGIEFRLSFYKDDIIQYEKGGEIFTERFLSRTMPNKRNYVETKPINKSKFEKQHAVGLGNTQSIRKINTDILGNQYIVTKEKQ